MDFKTGNKSDHKAIVTHLSFCVLHLTFGNEILTIVGCQL